MTPSGASRFAVLLYILPWVSPLAGCVHELPRPEMAAPVGGVAQFAGVYSNHPRRSHSDLWTLLAGRDGRREGEVEADDSVMIEFVSDRRVRFHHLVNGRDLGQVTLRYRFNGDGLRLRSVRHRERDGAGFWGRTSVKLNLWFDGEGNLVAHRNRKSVVFLTFMPFNMALSANERSVHERIPVDG